MITIVLPVWFTWFLVAWGVLNIVNGVLYLVVRWLEYRLKLKPNVKKMSASEFREYLRKNNPL